MLTCAARAELGGKLTLTILEARNLPNTENFGATSGVTDPYVVVTIDGSVRRTRTIMNNLNPVWGANGQQLQFGVKASVRGPARRKRLAVRHS